jgi:hypothetical protein
MLDSEIDRILRRKNDEKPTEKHESTKIRIKEPFFLAEIVLHNAFPVINVKITICQRFISSLKICYESHLRRKHLSAATDGATHYSVGFKTGGGFPPNMLRAI